MIARCEGQPVRSYRDLQNRSSLSLYKEYHLRDEQIFYARRYKERQKYYPIFHSCGIPHRWFRYRYSFLHKATPGDHGDEADVTERKWNPRPYRHGIYRA